MKSDRDQSLANQNNLYGADDAIDVLSLVALIDVANNHEVICLTSMGSFGYTIDIY